MKTAQQIQKKIDRLQKESEGVGMDEGEYGRFRGELEALSWVLGKKAPSEKFAQTPLQDEEQSARHTQQ